MAATIVMVTYNSAHVIRHPLGALEVLPDDWEVVVVDNASTDATPDLIQKEFPRVRLLRNASNVGFARAVNMAAASARNEVLLLLNPDVLVQAHMLERLAERFASQPDAAVIAPLQVSTDQGHRTVTAGRDATVPRMFLHASGLSRLSKYFPALEGHYLFRDAVDQVSRTVDWVSGSCMMVRTEVWRSLGGLSERWFMYAEDIEFCRRVRLSGRSVLLDATLQIDHVGGGSSSGVDGRVNPAWIVNLYDFYKTSIGSGRIRPAVWKACVVSGFAARLAVYSGARVLRPNVSNLAQVTRYKTYLRALVRAK